MADEVNGALQTTVSATRKVVGDALAGAMIGALIGGTYSLFVTVRRIMRGQNVHGAGAPNG